MKHWRLWAVIGMYGALYGLMGGLLALQNPAGALLWAVAMVATVGYSLASEGAGRRYSAAGVERLKIETAERMHRDRLESREAMHAAATEAWENVLTAYLDREFRE